MKMLVILLMCCFTAIVFSSCGRVDTTPSKSLDVNVVNYLTQPDSLIRDTIITSSDEYRDYVVLSKKVKAEYSVMKNTFAIFFFAFICFVFGLILGAVFVSKW